MSHRDWKFNEIGENYNMKYLENTSYYPPNERSRVIWNRGEGHQNNLHKPDNWNPNLIFKL